MIRRQKVFLVVSSIRNDEEDMRRDGANLHGKLTWNDHMTHDYNRTAAITVPRTEVDLEKVLVGDRRWTNGRYMAEPLLSPQDEPLINSK